MILPLSKTQMRSAASNALDETFLTSVDGQPESETPQRGPQDADPLYQQMGSAASNETFATSVDGQPEGKRRARIDHDPNQIAAARGFKSNKNWTSIE